LKCHLIYNTIFGSVARAAEWATAIDTILISLDPARMPSARRICGYAYHIAGDLEAAHARFAASACDAESLHQIVNAVTALMNRGSVYVDQRQYDTAWQCYEEASELIRRSDVPPPRSLLATAAEFAFARGDLDGGVALTARVSEMGPLRYRLDRSALQLLSLAVRSQPCKQELEDTLRTFKKLRSLGLVDFAAGAIAYAISRRDIDAARLFAIRYLQDRRERGPLGNPFLLKLLPVATTPCEAPPPQRTAEAAANDSSR
jgi:tetratricopeptide (TPR) repeat protein